MQLDPFGFLTLKKLKEPSSPIKSHPPHNHQQHEHQQQLASPPFRHPPPALFLPTASASSKPPSFLVASSTYVTEHAQQLLAAQLDSICHHNQEQESLVLPRAAGGSTAPAVAPSTSSASSPRYHHRNRASQMLAHSDYPGSARSVYRQANTLEIKFQEEMDAAFRQKQQQQLSKHQRSPRSSIAVLSRKDMRIHAGDDDAHDDHNSVMTTDAFDGDNRTGKSIILPASSPKTPNARRGQRQCASSGARTPRQGRCVSEGSEAALSLPPIVSQADRDAFVTIVPLRPTPQPATGSGRSARQHHSMFRIDPDANAAVYISQSQQLQPQPQPPPPPPPPPVHILKLELPRAAPHLSAHDASSVPTLVSSTTSVGPLLVGAKGIGVQVDSLVSPSRLVYVGSAVDAVAAIIPSPTTSSQAQSSSPSSPKDKQEMLVRLKGNSETIAVTETSPSQLPSPPSPRGSSRTSTVPRPPIFARRRTRATVPMSSVGGGGGTATGGKQLYLLPQGSPNAAPASLPPTSTSGAASPRARSPHRHLAPLLLGAQPEVTSDTILALSAPQKALIPQPQQQPPLQQPQSPPAEEELSDTDDEEEVDVLQAANPEDKHLVEPDAVNDVDVKDDDNVSALVLSAVVGTADDLPVQCGVEELVDDIVDDESDEDEDSDDDDDDDVSTLPKGKFAALFGCDIGKHNYADNDDEDEELDVDGGVDEDDSEEDAVFARRPPPTPPRHKRSPTPPLRRSKPPPSSNTINGALESWRDTEENQQ